MSLAGTWRITEMDLWAQEAVDLLGPGFFEFDGERHGTFRFVAVQGWMDCRHGEREGRTFVEFSWAGRDDRDPASGRGWAVLEQGGALRGHIFFHQGDDSGFRAVRDEAEKPGRASRRARGARERRQG